MLSEVTVGNRVSRSVFAPMMFSDRGDPWAGSRDADVQPGLSRIDMTSIASGLVGQTLIATEYGWTPVQDLRPGDKVVTFDNGLQPVRRVQNALLWTAEKSAPKASWPLLVPARALGNRDDMVLMPQQDILIEADSTPSGAPEDDAYAVIAAACLDGVKGITRTPPQREMSLYTLIFDTEQVVYAQGTLLVPCAGLTDPASATATTGAARRPAYRRMTGLSGVAGFAVGRSLPLGGVAGYA